MAVEGSLEWLLPAIDGPALLLSAITVALVVAALAGARVLLRRQVAHRHDSGFREQLTMLVLTLLGAIVVLLTLPVERETRQQLVSLFGLLLSAAIALSSTTFLGNMMAGLMLRAVRSFRAGDFLRCNEHFGRITTRGLLHTELQTEDSDLTTLPNLHLVTTPYTVVRANGTIVTATVSLGYDAPRHEVERLLQQAAEDVPLAQPFVHVVELGDFSVLYRVGGVLEEVKHLLSRRSELRCRMLDRLHGAGIEIASPTLMSTRAFPPETAFVPEASEADSPTPEVDGPSLEELAFEKADQAATVEELSERVAATTAELARIREAAKAAKSREEKAALGAERERLENRAERQRQLLEQRKAELEERGAEGD